MFNNFFPENRAVYEIMWENMVQADRLLPTAFSIDPQYLTSWMYTVFSEIKYCDGRRIDITSFVHYISVLERSHVLG